VVVAHFVTSSSFRLNCQQKFNFWAASRPAKIHLFAVS
jgi:hypothetical protein